MNRAYTAANPATRLDNLGSAPDSCAIEYMSSDAPSNICPLILVPLN
ncbi:MAG: hypothetical protein K8963_01625 [Proteobacteria bacterium]|nr:hypothetical protein [Pseudomonadota bacterium]